MEVERGMVIEVGNIVSVRNLGWRQMLRLMRASISVCVLVVVVVVAGLVFFRERSLLVMEVEFSVVGFWLMGGGILSIYYTNIISWPNVKFLLVYFFHMGISETPCQITTYCCYWFKQNVFSFLLVYACNLSQVSVSEGSIHICRIYGDVWNACRRCCNKTWRSLSKCCSLQIQ